MQTEYKFAEGPIVEDTDSIKHLSLAVLTFRLGSRYYRVGRCNIQIIYSCRRFAK